MNHRFRPAAFLFAVLLLVGCSPAGQSPGASTVGSNTSPASSDSLAHTPPTGATGLVDADAWAIADRLSTSAYTADTTAALVAGLARSGIGTYDDPSSADPSEALTGAPSPFRLLGFQAHALAVGAWARSTFSGAELDTVVPLPSGLSGMPTTSELLAAYVASADSPGGALSRALMAGQDLLAPTKLRFPAIVLVLFASDLATDGGRLAPGPSPSAAARQAGLPMAGLALAGPGGRVASIQPAAVGEICSAAANWINGAIASLFNALKLATPDNVVGAIVTGIWNWLVNAAQQFVQGLLSSVTDAVLGTVRSIAAGIAAVATQVASILPYAIKVTAAGDGGGATFNLGSNPLHGTFTAAISAGDLPEWPAVLVDCAAVAQVALASFQARDIPLIWGPLQAPPDPLLAPIDSAITNDRTDASGRATWAFLTSVDPGDPTGEQKTQLDSMPVTVHRPEVEAARAHLTSALLGWIPGLVRPFVASLFAPYVDGLQARLNTLLDARGSGAAEIVFHAEASPAPSRSPGPTPSGACSPNPVTPGTYTGTMTTTSLETIDISSSDASTVGKTVATSSGSGPATVVVAADGSVGGSWTMRVAFVFDEMAGSSGTVVKEHRDEVMDYSAGTIVGSACQLALGNATLKIVSCMSLLKGDCSSDPVPSGPNSGLGVTMGAPSSVSPGKVTWTWQYTETGGQPSISATLTLSVSGP